MTDLPARAEQYLREDLETGERILWTGQPLPGRAMMKSLPILLFAIPWTAFSLFWESMAVGMFFWSDSSGDIGETAGGPGFWFALVFVLFGLPFVAIGIGMLSAPWWAAREARRTLYAITDRRALIVTAGRTRKIQGHRLIELDLKERTLHADGSGDVYFKIEHGVDSDGDRTTTKVGFTDLPDVREAERVLKSSIDGARRLIADR